MTSGSCAPDQHRETRPPSWPASSVRFRIGAKTTKPVDLVRDAVTSDSSRDADRKNVDLRLPFRNRGAGGVHSVQPRSGRGCSFGTPNLLGHEWPVSDRRLSIAETCRGKRRPQAEQPVHSPAGDDPR